MEYKLQDLNKMAVTQRGKNHFLQNSEKIHVAFLHFSFLPTALLQQEVPEKNSCWGLSHGFMQATIQSILIVFPF